MDSDKPLFILAGNGPYENRGCEAIVRGTTKILRHYYKNPEFVCVSHFQSEEQYKKQCENEIDDAINHKKTNLIKSVNRPEWVLDKLYRKFFPEKAKNKIYRDMLPYLGDARAILSVGGDNYSLDYGVPRLFTDLDDIVLKNNKPLIIWGASVGPFDKIPNYQNFMVNHLEKVTGIFVRESVSQEYLKKIGVTKNVYAVADPAFLLNPVQPTPQNAPLSIKDEAIGINLSPLMAYYVTHGDRSLWIDRCAKIISAIIQKDNSSIYLIPHVTSPHDNDFRFLEEVNLQLDHQKSRIVLIPPIYNAAETKWIISKMKIFIGTRTHATIAALSSEVPTLSLAYSIKAKGINQDIFGHERYCLHANQLNPETIVEKINQMQNSYDSICREINSGLPVILQNAMIAGKYLQEIVE